MYRVKELFLSLQGEGIHTGRTAVFCRFSGCNLWSGKEDDRSKALCQFCDTDFTGTDGTNGGTFTSARELVEAMMRLWPNSRSLHPQPMVVCTGGEPLLQLDQPLIQALHQQGFTIAIETNGTIPAPAGLDWICVSPKAGTELKVTSGNELKLVYPQIGLIPEQFTSLSFDHFILQPRDGPDQARNTHLAADYCLEHPLWRLGLQMHKFIGLR